MAYDVARVRGLHPSLGDGWVHFDAQNGMLLPDSVATTVSTAFRDSMTDDGRPASLGQAQRGGAGRGPPGGRRPGQRRSRAASCSGADRAILLTSLADASSSRVGTGLRGGGHPAGRRGEHRARGCARRIGTAPRSKWAEVDIETGELPTWQWESLITKATRLVAITSASATLGTVTDLRPVTKLVHDGRRPGRRRPLRGRAVPADRHRRDRRRRGGGERGRRGAVRRSARWCSATRR